MWLFLTMLHYLFFFFFCGHAWSDERVWGLQAHSMSFACKHIRVFHRVPLDGAEWCTSRGAWRKNKLHRSVRLVCCMCRKKSGSEEKGESLPLLPKDECVHNKVKRGLNDCPSQHAWQLSVILSCRATQLTVGRCITKLSNSIHGPRREPTDVGEAVCAVRMFKLEGALRIHHHPARKLRVIKGGGRQKKKKNGPKFWWGKWLWPIFLPSLLSHCETVRNTRSHLDIWHVWREI